MASLNEIFPGFGETQIPTNQTPKTREHKLMCPICSNRAIRHDIHTGISLCSIGHQWTINREGKMQTPQGMFFTRKQQQKPPQQQRQQQQFEHFRDRKQDEEQYQRLIRDQYQHLERQRDFDNFEWSARNLDNKDSMMDTFRRMN